MYITFEYVAMSSRPEIVDELGVASTRWMIGKNYVTKKFQVAPMYMYIPTTQTRCQISKENIVFGNGAGCYAPLDLLGFMSKEIIRCIQNK